MTYSFEIFLVICNRSEMEEALASGAVTDLSVAFSRATAGAEVQASP